MRCVQGAPLRPGLHGPPRLWHLLLALVLWLGLPSASESQDASEYAAAYSEGYCDLLFGDARDVTIIMVADPGNLFTTTDAQVLLSRAQNFTALPAKSTLCQAVTRARVLGQDIAIIASGLGQRPAAVCTTSLLGCGHRIRDIIFFGRSGWSVQQGGVLNTDDCSAANTRNEVVRLGDLCIGPSVVDGSCRKASWRQQCDGYPNICSLPSASAPASEERLLGECAYSGMPEHSVALSAELYRAAVGSMGLYPTGPEELRTWELRYWIAMSKYTSVAYTLRADGQPSIHNNSVCAEVSSSFDYSGVPYDMQARATVAELLSVALGEPKTARDVIAVTAAEGVGFVDAMERYNSQPWVRRPVPYTILRAASSYLHGPVLQDNKGVWGAAAWPSLDEELANSHAMAIGTRAILRLLQGRCLNSGTDELCELTDL